MFNGKGREQDLCEGKLLEEALLVNQDSLIGIVWVTRRLDQLSHPLSSDLLARLTGMPFWLDQGGRFGLGVGGVVGEGRTAELNHWSETDQIAWLAGGYFVGDAFQSDRNRSDIIFNGIDHTGLILNMKAK